LEVYYLVDVFAGKDVVAALNPLLEAQPTQECAEVAESDVRVRLRAALPTEPVRPYPIMAFVAGPLSFWRDCPKKARAK
jgi:hypothetical protein